MPDSPATPTDAALVERVRKVLVGYEMWHGVSSELDTADIRTLCDALDRATRERDEARATADQLMQEHTDLLAWRTALREKVRWMQGWAANSADGGKSMVTVVHGEWLERAAVLRLLDE